jgi:pilus assembly protein CpaC
MNAGLTQHPRTTLTALTEVEIMDFRQEQHVPTASHPSPQARRAPARSRRSRCLIASGVASAMALLMAVGAAAQTVKPATRPAASASTRSSVSQATPAGPSLIKEGTGKDGKVQLKVNRSVVITTRSPYKRVSVAQPEVADVNLLGPDTILLTAKKAGITQMIVWDDDNQSQVVDVNVEVDLDTLRQQLTKMFPSSKIEAVSVNGSLALRGQVPTIEVAEQAAQIAAPYGQKVLNFLEVAGGQQVMLQVKFAEISRTASSQLGVNLGFTDGRSFGGSNVGQVNPFGIENTGPNGTAEINLTNPNPAVTLFGTGQIGQTAFAYFINALRSNNLLRILAEPNLIAISGQEASFLAGGEFPIPVSQGGDNGISIEYREFGVKLKMTPVVLGDGRIRLKVAPEVSDLDFTTAVRFGGFVIPGLTSRKVNTTIELNEGQTFAIAGLLNNNMTASKDVTPVLGDLPVIGALFRSVRYQRKETELVVLVTPRLVEGMNPGQVPPLPGGKWRDPTEADLFINGDLGGPVPEEGPATRPANRPAAAPVRYVGEYGFTPASPADRGAIPAGK